ncbi:cytochrome c biogenesis protein ResB [Cryptosporangium arvum]|uniref:cytochrome c biogenesis protein ResB n=1 Tax=Cryptosporangium arvum TaxID=80871 RepID=UPI0004AEC9B9|nr:cytochrome c biogenesis protein ResB [Cryptosporangium arvum]
MATLGEQDAVTGLATAPEDASKPEDRRAGRGPIGPSGPGRLNALLEEPRRWWRILTSMRTALVLLFLLALAAVPGSTFPQRDLNQNKVDEYFAEHPKLAPFLDKLSAFDVFASPWFAAIYLLLFISLVGCLVPRIRVHARAMVKRPPAAPRHLDRLPVSGAAAVAGDPSAIADSARGVLRRARWRTVVRTETSGAVTVSAEKGYLRETGNLAFHVALVGLLVGVASGSLWGWKASVLTVEGNAFCDTVQAYDSFSPGSRMRDAALPSFCVRLDDFQGTYLENGQPEDFLAKVRYIQGDRAFTQDPDTEYDLKVNHPLRLDGANVYLINHGYAPVLKYTDRFGTVFEETPAFLPQDVQLTSEGAFVLPDANQDPKSTARTSDVQMAFTGFFLPTASLSGPPIRSISPEAKDPAVTLVGYRGDTGLDSGIARSVYSIDQNQVDSGALKSVGSKKLSVGEVWKLDDGTTLQFAGYREFMTVQVGHDPGEMLVLVSAGFMLVGLIASLTVRRRRIFVRVTGDGELTVGGLARTDPDRFADEFQSLVERIERTAPAKDRTAPAKEGAS